MPHYRNGATYLGAWSDGAVPPQGAIQCPAPNRSDDVWNGSGWDARVKSGTERDVEADAVANAFLEGDMKIKALGLVMADVAEAALGLTKAQARQEVKTRFRNYYRTLL